MLDSKSENTTAAMRFADITQSKINSIIQSIKDGSNRRPNGSIDELNGTKLFYTDREGRREVLGSLDAKETAMLKTYNEHGYPTVGRFHTLLLRDYANISKSTVREWMNNYETVQRAKTAPSTKLIRRPIVSSRALAFCQRDLVDMKNYPSKGYLWLFCFLDVYSRFLIAKPLRNKTAQSCA